MISDGIPILFADDTNGIYFANSYQCLENKLNTELSKISDWFRINKLAVNETKTKYIIFNTKFNPKPPENFTVILNEKILERVSNTKFLGVFIQENMQWDTHITHVGNKLAKITAVLSRLKYQLPTTILKTIYNSLFSPYIMYGLSVWGSSPASHLDRITKLQKKAVRHISHTKYNSHTEPIMKKLKLLNVSDSYKVQCCKIYYKKMIGILHEYHDSKLISRSTNQERTTRQSNDIIVAKPVTYLHRHTLNNKVSAVWNSLPNYIKDRKNHSEHSFVRALRNYFLSNYKDNCTITGCYICNRPAT